MSNNVYYGPEFFGLEAIGSFEWADLSWEFDTLAVWKERRGRYWLGQDSGCSCPSPFEWVTDINQLDGPHTKDGLRKRIDFLIEERTREYGGRYLYSKSELKRSASEILSRIT